MLTRHAWKVVVSIAFTADVWATGDHFPDNHLRFKEMFTRALESMAVGNPIEASTILAALLLEKQTERIWLEYGRSLFLSDKLEEAEKVFNYIIFRYPMLPDSVARNVKTFQSKIDRSQFKITPEFSVGYDGNPYNLTDARTVYLFGGTPFKYSVDPSQDKGRAYQDVGIKLNGRLINRMKWQSRTSLKDYSNKSLDRKINLLDLTFEQFSSDNLRIYPALSFHRIDDQMGSSRWNIHRMLSAQIRPFSPQSGGINFYKSRSYYDDDGRHDSSLLGLGAMFSSQHYRGSYALRLDRQKNRSSKESESYSDQRIQAGYQSNVGSASLGAEVGWSYKNFEGDQPPFYSKRSDREKIVKIIGKFPSIPIFNRPMTIEVERNSRSSTINYYSSVQIQISLIYNFEN